MEKISEFEKLVLQAIPKGKQNAKYQKEISTNLGIRTRDFREVIHSLRLAGIPVCSSPYCGYWIPETMDEFRELLGVLEAYLISHQETIDRLTESYNKYDSIKAVMKNVN